MNANIEKKKIEDLVATLDEMETFALKNAKVCTKAHSDLCTKVHDLLGKGRTVEMMDAQAESSARFTEAMEAFAYARGLHAAAIEILKVIS